MKNKEQVMFFTFSMRGGGSAEVISKLAWHFSREMAVTICTLESAVSMELPANVQVEVLKIRKSPLLGSLITYLQIFIQLRRTITRLNPTKIVSFIHIANIICVLASWRAKAKVIVCERSDILSAKIGWLWKIIRPPVYWHADTVCLQNSDDRYQLPNYLWRKIIIARNPIKEPAPTRASSHRLIAIGRLHPVKRFDLMIKLSSEVLKKNPQLQLHIFGEGSERTFLEKLIADSDLKTQVVLCGHTNDIPGAISESSIFLMTSSSEGQPNALLEALAAGLPALCLDTSNCFKAIKISFPHVQLINPSDEHEFTKKLDSIVTSGANRFTTQWENWNEQAWSEWRKLITENERP